VGRRRAVPVREPFHRIALDYPCFGLSSPRPGYRYLPEEHAQVVIAFVDALALSGVTLVAQDWGGPIGLATVEARPAAWHFATGGRRTPPAHGDIQRKTPRES
jgi:pimeloyl-ACP methyl ester carboxylesterase